MMKNCKHFYGSVCYYIWLIQKSSLDLSLFRTVDKMDLRRQNHGKKVTASAKTSRNEFGEKMYYGNLSVLQRQESPLIGQEAC